MINKKSYLKQYFKILKDNLKLNIDMSSGKSKDDLQINSQELMRESDEYEEEANEGNVMENNEDYHVENSSAFGHKNNFRINSENAPKERENEDEEDEENDHNEDDEEDDDKVFES